MDMQPNRPPTKAGFLDRFLTKIAGVALEILHLCPLHDWDCVRAIAYLLLLIWGYQVAVFSLITHRLFAVPGQIRPELVLAAMFIATLILAIDSYMVMRSSWQLSGIEELKRGGLDISGGPAARIKAGFFLAVRICLSACISILTATFLSLIVFGADIEKKIQSDYLQANAHLVPAARALVDVEIERTTEAVKVETARHAALSDQVTALRQNQIDPSANDPQLKQAEKEVAQLLEQKLKADDAVRSAETFASDELAGIKAAPGNSGRAGNGIRRKAAVEAAANAKAAAQRADTALAAARTRYDALHAQLGTANETAKQQASGQLPTYEKALSDESAKLADLQNHLAGLTENRDDAMRRVIDNDPEHIAPDNGILSQLRDMESIANSDNKIAAVIILIDLTAFGLELAAVLAKVTSFVPTTYATMLARDSYMRVVRMVEEIVAELDGDDSGEDLKGDARRDDGAGMNGSQGPIPFGGLPDPFSPPIKRPRGRPRKETQGSH